MTQGNNFKGVSEKERKIFERDGVVCLKGILKSDQIERLAKSLDQITSGVNESVTGYNMTKLAHQVWEEDKEQVEEVGSSQYDLDALAGWLKINNAIHLKDDFLQDRTKQGSFYLDTSTWKRNETIRRIALDSVLPQMAAELLQASRVNYFDDQVFVKEPFSNDRTAFHQDISYFNVTGHQGCVMWVSVDSVSSRNGGLSYIRGSHLWDAIYKANVFVAQTPFPGCEGENLPDIEGHLDKYDIIQFETEPGDVIVHHFNTVHGAGGNLMDRARRALSLRYCGDDMRYCKRPGVPSQPHHTHNLKDGALLDSEDFPMVWPKPFPDCSLSQLYSQIASV